MQIKYGNQRKVVCDCGKVHTNTEELFLMEPAPGSDLNKPILTCGRCNASYTLPDVLYNYLYAWTVQENNDIQQVHTYAT